MKLQQLILETYDNLFVSDVDKRRQYAEQVFNLLQNAYQAIGGLKGGGFGSPQDMVEEIPFWKLFRRGDQIKAVMMYKDTNGRKRVAMATDGSPEGKKAITRMLQDEYNQKRSYAEISGPSLNFHRRVLGDDGLDAITIPTDQAVEVLNLQPDEYRKVSDTEYQRQFKGEWITKRMVGSIGNTINR